MRSSLSILAPIAQSRIIKKPSWIEKNQTTPIKTKVNFHIAVIVSQI